MWHSGCEDLPLGQPRLRLRLCVADNAAGIARKLAGKEHLQHEVLVLAQHSIDGRRARYALVLFELIVGTAVVRTLVRVPDDAVRAQTPVVIRLDPLQYLARIRIANVLREASDAKRLVPFVLPATI